jgi:DNA-binding GntR family transcriptional regulator
MSYIHVPFAPLGQVVQLGSRVYDSLLNTIVGGHLDFGAPLRPNEIARQLNVSTTPVREALGKLESHGIVNKLPNCGWFVREFTDQQILDLYEFRSDVESFTARLACERISNEELGWLRQHQAEGEAALASRDMDAYRIYNREFHAAILRAAKNSYLSAVIGQIAPQAEMLTARTIRIAGRPLRAFEEHTHIIEALAAHNGDSAAESMHTHILGQFEQLLHMRKEAEPAQKTSEPGNRRSTAARSAVQPNLIVKVACQS